MSLKKYMYYIPIGLIILGIGYFLGYYFGWHPALEGIKNYIIASLSLGGVIEVGSRIREWWINKNQKKIDHSKELSKVHLKTRIKESIGFTLQYSRCDLRLQINNELTTQEYDWYSKEINMHLKEGYPEIWNMILLRTNRMKQHNNKLKLFLDSLNLKILKGIKNEIPNIVEWDTELDDLTPPKKYYTKDLQFEIGWFVQYVYTKPFSLNLNCTPETRPTKFKLSLSRLLIVSDDEVEIVKIKKIIKDIFNTETNSESNFYKELKTDFEDINKNIHEPIIKSIIEIIKDVDNNIPLKKECVICERY